MKISGSESKWPVKQIKKVNSVIIDEVQSQTQNAITQNNADTTSQYFSNSDVSKSEFVKDNWQILLGIGAVLLLGVFALFGFIIQSL